jgi:hypothetical protein
MAGLRQGLASAAPERPQRSGGRRDAKFLGAARNAKQGKKVCGPLLRQGGKRRSRRLPTKAINEDVGERGSGRYTPKRFGKDWRAFNVWLTGSVRNWYDGVVDPRRGILPTERWTKMPRRAGCLLGDADFWDWSRMTARAVTHSPSPNTRHAAIFVSLFAGGDSKHHNRLDPVAVQRQLTKTTTPHPVLPGGAL